MIRVYDLCTEASACSVGVCACASRLRSLGRVFSTVRRLIGITLLKKEKNNNNKTSVHLVSIFKYCSDLFRLEVQFPFIMDSIKSCFFHSELVITCVHIHRHHKKRRATRKSIYRSIIYTKLHVWYSVCKVSSEVHELKSGHALRSCHASLHENYGVSLPPPSITGIC